MRIQKHQSKTSSARGFSLIELMAVIVIMSVVLAAVLTQVSQVEQRSSAEQGRVDDFQQARDFMAQIVREGRIMGYPNIHNFDTSGTAPACGAWQLTPINDCGLAVGLVKLTPTELDFEGDVDGTGNVSEVSYKINGDGLCALCMERAQKCKGTGNPLTQAGTNGNGGVDRCGNTSSWVQEVQNVLNTANVASPVFSAFNASGVQIVLGAGIDINTTPTSVAQVRVIKVNLDVANPTSIDPKTRQQLEADITGNIQIVNCSMATTAATLGITIGQVQLTCQ